MFDRYNKVDLDDTREAVGRFQKYLQSISFLPLEGEKKD
jgi:hypothetical protein